MSNVNSPAAPVPAARFATGPGNVASISEDLAARVATASCSVLLTGETGVGKGHLARWLHERSPRASRSFIPVNCGAIPEGIIDSHLFGHAKGSFSDAHQDHLGLVRGAEGGTLFLDEVGELPPTAQLRLLRLLEEREVQPVGRTRPVTVDVRIIAATACALRQRVERGDFRDDLFYRLNVIHMELAPLRSRPQDVPALVEEFNALFAGQCRRPSLRIRPAAMRFLCGFPWPGNVRQLRTVIERLHVLCPREEVTVEDLCAFGQMEMPAPRSGGHRLQEARLAAVRRTLDVCGGNISRAARSLGVHRSTVHRWLAEPVSA